MLKRIFWSAAGMGNLLLLASLVSAQEISVYRTLPDLGEALKQQPSLRFSEAPSTGITLHVDETKRYQTMDGFGASFTESATWLLETKLSASQRNRALRDLLDPTEGIGVNFLRQPLGASDLSRNHYSFDEMPKGEKDSGLKHFSLQRDEETVLPLLREAFSIRPQLTVMLTPWSPPGWMKTSGSMVGGSLLDSEFADYADYLVRSIQGYQKAGVPVSFLTLQNEPLYVPKDYPGMLMLAAQQKRLVQVVGPALAQAGLSTKLLVYDHNWDHPEYPMEILADSTTANLVAGTAFHCYGGDPTAQTTVHDRFPEKGIWVTECSGGTWQKGNLLAVTAQLILRSTRNWAKSVVLWGMVLDQKNGPNAGGCDTCRGFLTVDTSKTPATVTRTVDYYAVGQASRFVLPSAVRIASDDFGGQSLESAAFQNPDGSIALLVLNNENRTVNFNLGWHDKLSPASIPAGSFVTYTWRAK